ncbi:MAG: radical SAM protein [Chlamydiae bacterium]|nr:radical SAM protein [Chlamydiota bacterium]
MSLEIYKFDSYKKKEQLSTDCNEINLTADISQYKFSLFNHLFEHNDYLYAFNSTTSILIKLPQKNKQAFECISQAKSYLENNLFKLLIKYGFIISKDDDEIAKIRTNIMAARFKTDSLSLTIMTTDFCNFKCPYCYEGEEKKRINLTEPVQDEILKILDILSSRIIQFKIMWLGGEPLCALNIIENLSEKAIGLCEKKNIKFSAGIITNGYLLTEATVKKLKKYHVEAIQVTVDGYKEVHDRTRILLNGKGTYDKIFKNIEVALKYYDKITIRVNIDRNNFKSAKDFLHDLKKKNLEKNLPIYFAKIFTSPFYKDKSILTQEEFLNIQDELYQEMDMLGFSYPNFKLYPKLQANNCTATKALSFVVDPSGQLYKCDSDIGDKTKTIGNVFDISYSFLQGFGSANHQYCNKHRSSRFFITPNFFDSFMCCWPL